MADLKITLTVSDKNEGTRAPWWMIIDPLQNMRCDLYEAASQITGPFFSREEAQDFLDATQYNFKQPLDGAFFESNRGPVSGDKIQHKAKQ